jgi:hypothetical protein
MLSSRYAAAIMMPVAWHAVLSAKPITMNTLMIMKPVEILWRPLTQANPLLLQVRQLQQQLAAREQEVAALREIAEAATELQSQDVQAAKVIELSKKVNMCISAKIFCVALHVQHLISAPQWSFLKQHTLNSSLLCMQNRSLNLLLEKERQKVAKLQQSLSQASSKEASTVSCRIDSTQWCRVTCISSCGHPCTCHEEQWLLPMCTEQQHSSSVAI